LLAVWFCGLLVAVTTGVLAVAGAVVARQRAESAADLAALAGASGGGRTPTVASPDGADDGCAAAGRVAAAAGARLVACVAAGSATAPDLRILVEVPVPAVLAALDVPPARARARAGVPP
jgi:secretion/DNA translocation related TadE-like protein